VVEAYGNHHPMNPSSRSDAHPLDPRLSRNNQAGLANKSGEMPRLRSRRSVAIFPIAMATR
jgi:hypothetical protein